MGMVNLDAVTEHCPKCGQRWTFVPGKVYRIMTAGGLVRVRACSNRDCLDCHRGGYRVYEYYKRPGSGLCRRQREAKGKLYE